MNIPVKSIALGISLAVNALCAALFALALSAKTASVSYARPDDEYLGAAVLAIVPPSASVLFNPVEITMKPGEQAALQFSFIRDGKQANFLISALYDRDVVAVEPSGYGVTVTALAEGETLMQTLTSNEGIVDIALIRIQP